MEVLISGCSRSDLWRQGSLGKCLLFLLIRRLTSFLGPFPGSRKSTIETHLQNVLVYDTLYVALLYMVGDFEEQIRNNSKCQKIFIIWHKEKPRWAEGLKLSWIHGSMKLIWDDTPRWAEERVCWCFQGRNHQSYYTSTLQPQNYTSTLQPQN